MRASANPPNPASHPPPPLPEFLSVTVRMKVCESLLVPAPFVAEAVTVIGHFPRAFAVSRIDLPSGSTTASATSGLEEKALSE